MAAHTKPNHTLEMDEKLAYQRLTADLDRTTEDLGERFGTFKYSAGRDLGPNARNLDPAALASRLNNGLPPQHFQQPANLRPDQTGGISLS